jgi:hypothetical protein
MRSRALQGRSCLAQLRSDVEIRENPRGDHERDGECRREGEASPATGNGPSGLRGRLWTVDLTPGALG